MVGKSIDKVLFYQLLLMLAAQRSADFVGVGLIVYNTVEDLPVVPLGARLVADLSLPISGTMSVMRALTSLGTRGNSMHDGFHLIEAASGNLTHVAQFVSPPLDAALANPLAFWPQGARQMTALLISTLPQVDLAAVVSADGNVHLYENGMEDRMERLSE